MYHWIWSASLFIYIYIDVNDIILTLSIILDESDTISACQLKDADFNGDRIVNINDIIGMIYIIINN